MDVKIDTNGKLLEVVTSLYKSDSGRLYEVLADDAHYVTERDDTIPGGFVVYRDIDSNLVFFMHKSEFMQCRKPVKHIKKVVGIVRGRY